jgi:hypothetical protein
MLTQSIDPQPTVDLSGERQGQAEKMISQVEGPLSIFLHRRVWVDLRHSQFMA